LAECPIGMGAGFFEFHSAGFARAAQMDPEPKSWFVNGGS